MINPFEKRNDPRVKTEKFTIKYRFPSEEVLTQAAVLDVSASGICFLRNAPLNKKDVIEIMFPFKSKNVILKAQVMRVEGREVGIQFIDTPTKIDDFVNLFNKEYKIIRELSIEEEEKEKNLFIHRKEDQKNESIKNIDDILSDI